MVEKYGGYSPRIIGTDLVKRNVSLPTAELIQPSANQYFDAARARMIGSSDTISQGTALASQLSQQITENQLRANQAIAESLRTQARVAGTRADYSSRLLGQISQQLYQYWDAQQRQKSAKEELEYKRLRDAIEDQREAARLAIQIAQEQRAEEAFISDRRDKLTKKLREERERRISEYEKVAVDEYAKLELESQPILYNYGIGELHSRLSSLNEKYRGSVSPKFIVEWSQRILQNANEEQNRFFTNTYQKVRELQNLSSQHVVESFKVRVMPLAVQMASGRLSVSDGIDQIEKSAQKYIEDNKLSLEDSLRVRLAATEQVLKSGSIGLEEKEKILVYNQRLNQAIIRVNQLREEERVRQIPENERVARLLAISAETGISFGDIERLADPYADIRKNIEINDLTAKLSDLEKKQIISQIDKVKFAEYNIGDAVGKLITQYTPSQAQAYLNSDIVKGTAFGQHLAGVFKDYQEYVKLRSKTTMAISTLSIQKERLKQEFLQLQAGGSPQDQIVELLRRRAIEDITNNPNLPDDVKAQVQSTAIRALDIGAIQGILQNIDSQYNSQIARLQADFANVKANMARYGLDDVEGGSLERMRAKFKAQIEGYQNTINNLPAVKGVTSQGAQSNFNPGGSRLIPVPSRIGITKTTDGVSHEPIKAYRRLTTISYKGKKFATPFLPGTKVIVSDDYGGPGTEVYKRRGREHAGIDFAVASGTPIVSPVAGKVVKNAYQVNERTGRGYGYYIDIQIPDGRILRFAHNSLNLVNVGENVYPGDIIARSGSSGASGAHLHFEVRDGKHEFYFTGTTDPKEFLAEVASGYVTFAPRRNNSLTGSSYNPFLGDPPDDLPRFDSKAVALPLGKFLFNGNIYSPRNELAPTQQLDSHQMNLPMSGLLFFNRANPIPSMYTPSRTDGIDLSKINKPNQNYGYSAIAKDPSYAKAIADFADWLGVPAVWVADVLHFESNHDPTLVNQFGCVGIAQFCNPEEYGGRDKVLRAGRIGQLQMLKKYFSKWGLRGNIKSMAELYTAFQRPAYVKRLQRGDYSVLDMRDGNGGSIREYIEKYIGREVGRKYRVEGGDRRLRASNTIHDRYESGCRLCNQLVASNSPILPHELEA